MISLESSQTTQMFCLSMLGQRLFPSTPIKVNFCFVYLSPAVRYQFLCTPPGISTSLESWIQYIANLLRKFTWMAIVARDVLIWAPNIHMLQTRLPTVFNIPFVRSQFDLCFAGFKISHARIWQTYIVIMLSLTSCQSPRYARSHSYMCVHAGAPGVASTERHWGNTS